MVDPTPPPNSPTTPEAHCTNCGVGLSPLAVACTSCGFDPRVHRRFCRNCGTATAEGQVVCTSCGSAVGLARREVVNISSTKSKVAAGVLGILLGNLGIHKFYLGRTSAGFIMLGVTLFGVCTGAFLFVPLLLSMAMLVIGIIEGIIYLTKSDLEFEEIYVVGKKEWF